MTNKVTKEENEKLQKETSRKTSFNNAEEVNILMNLIKDINVNITVAGKTVSSDVKPFIYKEEEDVTLVPLRAIAEALGFQVDWSKWNDNTSRVLLSSKDKGMIMEIGRDFCYINGEPVKMNIAPEIHNDRTYLSTQS